MKKSTILLAVLALFLSTTTVFAGSKNATYVKFTHGGQTFYSYWMETGSGLVHEWRFNEAGYDLHFVFKPAPKFKAPDCDSENLWVQYTNWSYSIPPYNDTVGDDEADLVDFLKVGDKYQVCAYRELVE